MSNLTQEIKLDVRQAVAHDAASERNENKVIEQKKAAGASLFAAIKKAAHLAGIETPPDDPKAYATWRRNVGTDSKIPAYVAAVKEEGPEGDPLNWAAHMVQFHVDPDAAVARHGKLIEKQAKKRIENKQKQEKQARKSSGFHESQKPAKDDAPSENETQRFTKSEEKQLPRSSGGGAKAPRNDSLPDALDRLEEIRRLLKKAPGSAVEDALGALDDIVTDLKDAIYQAGGR